MMGCQPVRNSLKARARSKNFHFSQIKGLVLCLQIRSLLCQRGCQLNETYEVKLPKPTTVCLGLFSQFTLAFLPRSFSFLISYFSFSFLIWNVISSNLKSVLVLHTPSPWDIRCSFLPANSCGHCVSLAHLHWFWRLGVRLWAHRSSDQMGQRTTRLFLYLCGLMLKGQKMLAFSQGALSQASPSFWHAIMPLCLVVLPQQDWERNLSRKAPKAARFGDVFQLSPWL